MTDEIYDIDEKLWEEYLSWCRANSTWPDTKGFYVWQEDQDLDTEDWNNA